MGIVHSKERLLANTKPNGYCLEYQGKTEHMGYIRVRHNGVRMGAHKVMYLLAHGEVPKGLVVRHTCDNKRCVNPEHLLLGSVKDNTWDAIERGLFPTGEKQGNSKLTEADVIAIRHSHLSQRALANHFGVSQYCIWSILSGKQWRHL